MRPYVKTGTGGAPVSLDVKRKTTAKKGIPAGLIASQLDIASGRENDFDLISLESMGVHLLFGEIDNYVIHEAMTFLLKANMLMNDDITIILNTIGGDCAEAFALIDVIEASRLPVQIVGMGNIISMGMLMICAGTPGKRIMLKNTTAMAHQFAGGVDGKFHELVAQHKSNLYMRDQFVAHFAKHTKLTKKQVLDIFFGPSDRYLSPLECKKYGIIDKVVDALPQF